MYRTGGGCRECGYESLGVRGGAGVRVRGCGAHAGGGHLPTTPRAPHCKWSGVFAGVYAGTG
ncbi:putative outer membrane protein [Treponema pallidum subsp. pertenue]|nr:putative outer membrane protein [Treponema pallidum subsp. pertenue]WGK72410.1 putative outer membrane protein [Treponema pallidum subsp. pertenue]WGK76303.1 putative outer membrane protein [Treponema pallidum subsp. pertenue]